jgi:hypothetical protein
MPKLNLKISQPSKIINFLKRFSGIDNSLLIEVENGFLKAKSHTPEKSVVKYSAVQLDEVFSEFSDIKENFKFGIYNIDKFASSCKFFGEAEFEFILDYEKVGADNTGTNMLLKNSSLRIDFTCAPLKLFTYISEDVLNKITDTASAAVDFILPKEQQAKLASLFSIDSDYSKLTFFKKGNAIKAKGKTFNLLLVEDPALGKIADCELSVFKHHYVFLDREDTQLYITDEKLILFSNESETKMIIGEAE